MLPSVNKVLRTSKIQSIATIRTVFKRDLTELVANPLNRPTPLSIQTLKTYAESQANLPVRLNLARFLSSELPIRFAVSDTINQLIYRLLQLFWVLFPVNWTKCQQRQILFRSTTAARRRSRIWIFLPISWKTRNLPHVLLVSNETYR